MELPPNSEKEQSSKLSSEHSGEIESKIRFHFLTLFPEIFQPVLSASLLGKAQKKGLASFQTIQIRDFATDRHRTVDDTPYGGGDGMLLKVDVLHAAWKKALESCSPDSKPLTLLLSPQGQKFDQPMARELADYRDLILVCGHYEGVDERFIELCVDREVSIGDYVLTGGELPAMVMADAISRWIPGVVGKEGSVTGDSLENNLLKYPQYTRPREYEGMGVPDVLLGGDHQAIARWREAQMRERTARKRPDLLLKSPKK
jgi:tRNA (guanine37-N1)-methyltransferase